MPEKGWGFFSKPWRDGSEELIFVFRAGAQSQMDGFPSVTAAIDR
jgi:hypothetical protein